ncbi:MAG: hypothetical protein LQ343_003586 [Gyalolechia ehrenbergii]|nr:MAG: hypothetical protein LQ343_003586 [Gyalolechia ehrenbergii]
MKRRFSFSSLRLKLSSASSEDAITPEGLESPLYSPTPSCMERPTISAHIIAELRVCCAIVVNETNPPDYDDVPDHREMLKKYIQERDAYRAQADRHAAKEQHKSGSGSNRRPKSSAEAHGSASYRHVPRNAATNFEVTTSVKKPTCRHRDAATLEPLEPTHTRASGKNPEKSQERSEALEQIRATLDTRPKTSAAACIDYSGPSVQSSNSTTRSNTTYNEFHRPSTGQTSLAISPGDDKRTSYGAGRVSEQILHDEGSAELADTTAKAWMAQELARRRAEYQSTGQAARPASRATLQSQRPSSRAGSIAESVFEGVRDYIKPRASMDSMRSESGYGLSRSQSRSGSIKSDRSKTWQRVKGLRRKNSWSSFRSAKPQPEPTSSTAPDGALNLNRALPALPGLDQYKEKKPKPTHIAQLIGGGRAKSMPNAKHLQQAAATVRPSGVVRNMSDPEDHKRQEDLKRAVEEKMRTGVIAQSQHLHPHPLVNGNSFYNMNEASISTVTAPSAPATSMPRPTTQTRKPGLRKKLSRFWSFSSDKTKPGKMIATN